MCTSIASFVGISVQNFEANNNKNLVVKGHSMPLKVLGFTAPHQAFVEARTKGLLICVPSSCGAVPRRAWTAHEAPSQEHSLT